MSLMSVTLLTLHTSEGTGFRFRFAQRLAVAYAKLSFR